MGKSKKKNKNVEAAIDTNVDLNDTTNSDNNSHEGSERVSDLVAQALNESSALFDEPSEASGLDVEIEASVFETPEEISEGLLPEVSEEEIEAQSDNSDESVDLEGSELEGFESAQIEDVEFIEDERVESIIESILFASDRPVSLASIMMVFKGTNVKRDKIKRALESLAVEYAGGRRGVTLEEVTGGYQVRTKIDNMNFLRGTVKARPFKLSGPALETLAIVAYKQPVVKTEIDQIRGVESGHLLRALMEKGLVNFEGKAENLPGKPMQYGTSRRFLEIFGLRNLKELPTLSQIDELLPEGIGDEEEQKPTLDMVTESMAQNVESVSYSQGEEELGMIESELSTITTSSEFFEQEKIRQKQKRDEEKAQNIREAIAVGEEVSTRDINWLKKYEEALAQGSSLNDETKNENIVEAETMELADKALAGNEENSPDEESLFSVEETTEDELPFEVEADEEPDKEGTL